MLLSLAAALAIVVQDHASLRAAPRSGAAELAVLWQGELLEVRGTQGGYAKVYTYQRERGGYLRSESLRSVGLGEAEAPALLAVLRFLRDSAGSEALGISYGAAYLKAAPAHAIDAEPFDAIARMAERLADQASGKRAPLPDMAAHLEVVEQLGVHMRTFERNGRIQVCYDGELFRRVLAQPGAGAEERAHAALGLTRPDCIDPAMGAHLRGLIDDDRRELLEAVPERGLTAMTRSRLHARRASVWASIAYEEARHGRPSELAAQRALSELLSVHMDELGDDRRAEYLDALVRVGAIRWAAAPPAPVTGPLKFSATPGDAGQTCLLFQGPGGVPLTRRCTYGIVWVASARPLPQGRGLVVAVQPLECWRELWVFHQKADTWMIDVLSPGGDDPEAGYVDFAGFVPRTKRLLLVRELKDHGRFRRRFEELRLDDLALVRQASTPELLADFGRWQDVEWRRDTLALH